MKTKRLTLKRKILHTKPLISRNFLLLHHLKWLYFDLHELVEKSVLNGTLVGEILKFVISFPTKLTWWTLIF